MIIELLALGTKWWISLPEGSDETFLENITQIIMEFENNYSRFDSNSLVSKLNDSKKLQNAPTELINMLNYAFDVYESTEGKFNISVGAALEKSGYGYKTDASSKISTKLKNDIKINDRDISLSKFTRIDLGGFGKGWLIEKIAGYLKSEGIEDFVINGGGDIAVGNYNSTIFIEHPLESNLQIGEINLKNNALASSSNIKRSWTIDGKNHTHIINPSKKPRTDILSMHVLAKNILFADTFSTVFMMVDRNKRLEYASAYNLEFMEILSDLTTYKTSGFNINLN